MKNILRLVVLALAFLMLSPIHVGAQSSNKKNKINKKADIQYEAGFYYDALQLYNKAYSKTTNKVIKGDITFKQAECYRNLGNTEKAILFYKRALDFQYNNFSLEPLLRIAEMLMVLGDYEGGYDMFTTYLESDPENKVAQRGQKSCKFAMDWEMEPTQYSVENVWQWNSQYNDFSPAFGDTSYKKVYFTSSRKGPFSEEGEDGVTGGYFSNIYISEKTSPEEWSDPKIVPAPISTSSNEASMSFSFNSDEGPLTTMFFTRCESDKKKKKSKECEICVSVYKNEGSNAGFQKVNVLKSDSSVSYVFPAVNPDGDVMIFSSNLKTDKSQGGYDLWITFQEGENEWTEPANLGEDVNTPGDEKFPFLDKSGVLYFASNGRAGMGGLDVYKAEYDETLGRYVNSVNMKSPINSSADDFGFIVRKDEEKGFFSSNRSGGRGGDDIYSFELLPPAFTVTGVIKDTKTEKPVKGAEVNFMGISISGDTVAMKILTNRKGVYNTELNPLTVYSIVVNKKGYLNSTAEVSTVEYEVSNDFVKHVGLDPIKKEIILPRIEYDFASWELRDSSKKDLDYVAQTLIENPNITISLISHTDVRGTEEYNLELSNNRARVCVEYLVSKGISRDRLTDVGKGESSPYIITKLDKKRDNDRSETERRLNKVNVGAKLSEKYINKKRKGQNSDDLHQYNRRTSFKVLREDYVPTEENK